MFLPAVISSLMKRTPHQVLIGSPSRSLAGATWNLRGAPTLSSALSTAASRLKRAAPSWAPPAWAPPPAPTPSSAPCLLSSACGQVKQGCNTPAAPILPSALATVTSTSGQVKLSWTSPTAPTPPSALATVAFPCRQVTPAWNLLPAPKPPALSTISSERRQAALPALRLRGPSALLRSAKIPDALGTHHYNRTAQALGTRPQFALPRRTQGPNTFRSLHYDATRGGRRLLAAKSQRRRAVPLEVHSQPQTKRLSDFPALLQRGYSAAESCYESHHACCGSSLSPLELHSASAAAYCCDAAFPVELQPTVDAAGRSDSSFPFQLQLKSGADKSRERKKTQTQRQAYGAPLPGAAIGAAAVAAVAAFALHRSRQLGSEEAEEKQRKTYRRRSLRVLFPSARLLLDENAATAPSATDQPCAVFAHMPRGLTVAPEGSRLLQWRRRGRRQQQEQDQAAGRRSAKAAPARCAASREGREVLLGNVSDFERGSLYEIKIDEEGKEKVVLAHLGSGEFYCVGSVCTHFGASMIKGILTSEDRVVCPWHDAEFDVKTGKCLSGPALDGLPTFPVTVREGKVFVFVPNDALPLKKGPLYTQRGSGGQKDQTFVIVGGGAAAAAAMETLRAEGFSGRIILISKEDVPPYDRTMLSKNFLAKPDTLLLRPQDFLERELGVELWLGTQVDSVDFANKTLSVRTRSSRGGAGTAKTLQFDKLLLCTGTTPRSLSHLPNGTARGIFTLRSLEDHQKLQQTLEEMCKLNSQPRVVIIGASFIGTETASAFKRRGFRDVTLVCYESAPLQRVLGSRVAGGIKQLLTSKGVRFIPHATVKGFTASGGHVTGVELSDGEVLQADIVMVGIGGDPCTKPFLVNGAAASGGAAPAGLAVDPLLRVVGLRDVFAAGDIASCPYVKTGEPLRVEHWNVAMQQGRVAAFNMLGHFKPYTNVPFFWSAVFGKPIRFAGSADLDPDDVIVEGDLEKLQFVAYYVKNDRVVAVCTMNRDPVAVAALDLLSKNLMPSPGELRQGFKNSEDILAIVHAEAAKSKKRLLN